MLATEIGGRGKGSTGESKKIQNELSAVMSSAGEDNSEAQVPMLPAMPAKFVDPPNLAEQEIEETDLIVDSSVLKVLVPAEVVIEDNNEDISSVSLPSSSSQSGKIGDGSIIQDGRSTFSEKVVGGRKVK